MWKTLRQTNPKKAQELEALAKSERQVRIGANQKLRIGLGATRWLDTFFSSLKDQVTAPPLQKTVSFRGNTGDCVKACKLPNTETPGKGDWLLLWAFQYYDYEEHLEVLSFL